MPAVSAVAARQWLCGVTIALVVLVCLTAPALASPRVRTAPRISVGISEGDSGWATTDLAEYIAKVSVRPGAVLWFDSFDAPLLGDRERAQADTVVDQGAQPIITWEPRRRSGARVISDAMVASGAFDPYLRASAARVRTWGRPLMIRFAHEMNGNWYPWARRQNGNTAASYIAMWRHVVDVFRRAGATNVRWIWSPNVADGTRFPFTDMYPGDAYVDWVALDGYNGTSPAWQSFDRLFATSYSQLAGLTRRPVMIAETASIDGTTEAAKADWIRSAFLEAVPTRYPRIRAIVWFDKARDQDWRVDSSAASLRAWKTVVTSSRYSATWPGRGLTAVTGR